jgi:glutamine amidotransferase
MCRFTAYFGKENILVRDILETPVNSLIKQSHEAREGLHGINADGFGLAWYGSDSGITPGVFKSIQPAWNDVNLASLINHIKSSCFLGHVRASTVGDVNQHNCHPFCFQDFSFAHNGTIRGFDNFKKRIISLIDEDLFLSIKGNTDSEYFFFLTLHFFRRDSNLVNAVRSAIDYVVSLQENTDFYSRLNIVVTNGEEILVARYVSKNQPSLSLKYCIKSSDGEIRSLIFSSEQIDDVSNWEEIPDNKFMYLNKHNMEIVLGDI